MAYSIVGTLTFTTQANRNNALTALQAVSVGNAVPWTDGPYSPGIATSGTLGLTICFWLDGNNDEEARTVSRALFNGFRTFARSGGFSSVTRKSG